MNTQHPSFAGKVLSVLCVGEDTSQFIADPKWERLGGRLFLVGRVPERGSQDDWMKDLPTGIAWDAVQDYVVFDSVDDYFARLEAGPRKKGKKRK